MKRIRSLCPVVGIVVAVALCLAATGCHKDENSSPVRNDTAQTSSDTAEPAIAKPAVNRPVQLWRQQHPTDQRTDDEVTIDLATQSPEAFNTYPDAVADFRRILGNEYSLLQAGRHGFNLDNPLDAWLSAIFNEQERTIQERGEWDPQSLLKDGKNFTTRAAYLEMEKTNDIVAHSYWCLSPAAIPDLLAGIPGVPQTREIVTNEIEIPAKLSEDTEEAITNAMKIRFAPLVSDDQLLYKLDAVSVIIADEYATQEVVSDDSIRNRFEVTLRKYGIRVEDNAPASVMVSVGGVWVRPDLVVLSYECRSELHEIVTLKRKGDFRRSLATVWADDRGGVVGRSIAENAILQETEQMAEKFANDYLKANPKN